jgi:hypothetical protein
MFRDVPEASHVRLYVCGSVGHKDEVVQMSQMSQPSGAIDQSVLSLDVKMAKKKGGVGIRPRVERLARLPV